MADFAYSLKLGLCSAATFCPFLFHGNRSTDPQMTLGTARTGCTALSLGGQIPGLPLIKVEMAGTIGGGHLVCSFHRFQPNHTVILFIYTVSKSMPPTKQMKQIPQRCPPNAAAIAVLPEPNDQITSLMHQREDSYSQVGQWEKRISLLICSMWYVVHECLWSVVIHSSA